LTNTHTTVNMRLKTGEETVFGERKISAATGVRRIGQKVMRAIEVIAMPEHRKRGMTDDQKKELAKADERLDTANKMLNVRVAEHLREGVLLKMDSEKGYKITATGRSQYWGPTHDSSNRTAWRINVGVDDGSQTHFLLVDRGWYFQPRAPLKGASPPPPSAQQSIELKVFDPETRFTHGIHHYGFDEQMAAMDGIATVLTELGDAYGRSELIVEPASVEQRHFLYGYPS